MKLSWHFGVILDDLKEIFSEFSFASLRFRVAVKTAAATCLAIFLALWLEFKDPYFAGFAAMLMLHSNSAVTLKKAFHGCLGVILGGLCGYLAVGIFVNDHFAFTICLFVATALFSYLTNRHPSLSFAWYYASVNFILVAVTGAVQCSEAIDITFFRVANTLLGIFCYVLIAVLLFPEFGHDEFVLKLDRLRKKLCATFSCLMVRYASGLEMDAPAGEMLLENMGSIRSLEEELSDIQAESRIFDGTAAASGSFLLRSRDCVEKLGTFLESARASGTSPEFQKLFGPSFERIIVAANSFSAAKFDVENKGAIDSSLQEISIALEEIESGNLKSRYLESKDAYQIEDVLLFLDSLRCIRTFLGTHSEKYSNVSARSTCEMESLEPRAEDPDIIRIGIAGHRHLVIDWILARFSLKSALAVISDFWAYFWLEIPGSATTIAISAITVTKPDVLMTRHRSILRFSGCLVGAACAFVFLAFNVQTTIVMFIWLFVLTCVFAMIWGGRPGIAYLGFQAELAFLLSVIPGAAPAVDVEEPTQRIVAILLGVAIAWFVFAFVYPEDILDSFWTKFRRLRTSLAKILRDVTEPVMLSGGVLELRKVAPLEEYESLHANIALLRQHAEMPPRDTVDLDDFISAMDSFHRDARTILLFDKEVLEYFISANPGLAGELFSIGAGILAASDVKGRDALSIRISNLSERLSGFEKYQREKNLLGDKDFDFREETAALLLCIRRMTSSARRMLN
ncbi:MAG TPA: hypothetical protein DET40_01755 [Lentisphaeria bacterium]|nr:MAG: hypothetical protein A2X45_11665 [Lentisphaerae bacterium GWF2_50_93]HCE42257.1 hypothetical protein [Lentisphaeria bacterium]